VEKPKDPRVIAEIDRILREMMARAEVDDVDLPHSVILQDPETGVFTVTGPYPDAYIAAQESLRILEDVTREAKGPGEKDFLVHVALHFDARP